MSPKVYAIVLNYNGGALLRSCLSALFRSHYDNLRVVVVDNASDDDAFAAARRHFSAADYIQNAQNVGFAAGNNVGIRFALERDADYVIIINNDAIIAPDTIATMVRAAETLKTPSVLCPHILTPDGATWYAGATPHWLRMRVTHTTRLPQSAPRVLPTTVATGCVMLVHKDVFARIGLLNESYFLYYEDADFSLCAQRAGCHVGVVPAARAVHHEVSERAAHKPTKVYWLVLSALLFFTAHAPLRARLTYPCQRILRRLKARIAPRDTRTAPAVRRALRDFPQAKKHYVKHC